MTAAPLTLQRLNASASPDEFAALLAGTYEHSPWIAERAWAARPFASLAQLKHALAQVVDGAGREAQLALLRAHPELAGKAMVGRSLSAESTSEQGAAGLTHCTPPEFERLQRLNADYNAKFGWPFILAVRGPRGRGLARGQIIETFARRLAQPPELELQECLRNVQRIAEIRLDDKFALQPTLGNLVWDWAEELALYGDPGVAQEGPMVTHATEAHYACARRLQGWMADCGFDEVNIDAAANVAGVYRGLPQRRRGIQAARLVTGGRYDNRCLGILMPMACVRELHLAGRRLPFDIEVVAVAEEEGRRCGATLVGSSALTGRFVVAWRKQPDADGVTLRVTMQPAGLAGVEAATSDDLQLAVEVFSALLMQLAEEPLP